MKRGGDVRRRRNKKKKSENGGLKRKNGDLMRRKQEKVLRDYVEKNWRSKTAARDANGATKERQRRFRT